MKDDSLFSKFLYRYVFITDVESLSNKEKIGMFAAALFLVNIPCLWAYLDSNDWKVLLLSCGICVLFLGAFYPVFFYEKLNKKFNFYSTIRFGSSYQYISRTMAYVAPGLMALILIFGYLAENMFVASLIAFAFVLPFLALFFRIDVFNDDSCILGDGIVFGYHTTCYGVTSLLLGIYGYLKVYSLLNYNFNLAIIIFIITVIVQILFLIPDKINKHLFFELRRKNGFLLYATALILTFLVLSSVISDTAIINLNYFDLSFESIIKLIITWGVGIGLAILFARKIKKRGK